MFFENLDFSVFSVSCLTHSSSEILSTANLKRRGIQKIFSILPFFFWKRLISLFLLCKNRPTLWRIKHFINGFCITDKKVFRHFHKKRQHNFCSSDMDQSAKNTRTKKVITIFYRVRTEANLRPRNKNFCGVYFGIFLQVFRIMQPKKPIILGKFSSCGPKTNLGWPPLT